MSSSIPNPASMFGGDKGDKMRRGGFGIGTMFGIPAPMMAQTDKWQRKNAGGQDPSFLNPMDYFNGKLQGELTGDTSKDMRYGLAKYGLFAAPWAPALYQESKKKGSQIRSQQEAEAMAAANMANFNRAQPYQRNVDPIKLNPFGTGMYNDLASMMQNNPMGGLL